ncbi:bifunctional diguanylate cyclase/phosphodiesterase [Piscinibacter sp.]|uniref:bifunctional diguanylate cyclase/phosphodiesterase n=1 Tax=Piscinibacter sp. TaxID=1903157 RepID=UPI002B8E7171|nr:diguanylate cyclase [Albitalea sp.]HUG24999.1 diguanylate cyclase [Albitalea sp.]
MKLPGLNADRRTAFGPLMKMNISLRLGLLLAAFGVLATGLTGLYSFTESRALLVRAAERDLMTATQLFGHGLRMQVGHISDDVRVLAQLELIRGLPSARGAAAQAQKAALAGIFDAAVRAKPEYLQVRFIAAAEHGLELVRVDRDAQGTLRVGDAQLQEKAHMPYVVRALALPQGEVVLSKIRINHEAGSHAARNRPTLHVASPVRLADGTALGVVAVSVDVSRVFDVLKADLPPHLQLFLTNESGDFLIHPDDSQTFGFERGGRVLIQDNFAGVHTLLAGGTNPVLARTRAGREGSSALLGAFVKLPLSRAPADDFVVLGVARPLSDILQSTRVLGGTVLQIVLAFSAVAIVLAMFASRLVTRPLNQMTREVKRFSTDQVIGELPTERHDEIGDLARGFQEMQTRIKSAMAELDASRNHLAHLARHDALTGLPNRSVFIDRLEHAILSAKRTGGCLAVLFIDLDRFKHINDSHGHAVGDRALVQAASMLKEAVREVDTVARWGGDEFVILLEAMDEEHEARRVAQTLIDCFSQPMAVGGDWFDLGASIGISLYPRDGFDASELIQRADEAMYLSKHRDGNRYSVFGTESMK